ncbi:MAG: quinolinate synthase NadA [Deltaproteobacteria bacterium]|nr:quinolinate synthase NadA [Deltaproteobacteria bacterium]MBW1952107.1 quinolinate synthase NadA [Deltaproteobacteria bacterium]MBW1987630.1 quinolinate synthase NadA [Deltaproteobacteria bacterium]MBW2135603.1 quinolinate synthase NadA [Deltaproteobacteria bacterium]
MTLTSGPQEVRQWLAKRHGILLAHNYQPGEIQDIADLTGDSLGLSIEAAQTSAEVIVFCGVRFMAETAAILCPDKLVLLPRLDVGCYMADTITAAALRARKHELPGVPVVTYVNSYADVKAESDICCTSANAIRVVNSLPDPRVLMVPDRNLALYTARYTNKQVLYWQGCCNIHDNFTKEEVEACKAAHPGAIFMAHPECRPEVLDLAEVIRSTSGMLVYARQSAQREFIVGTEMGLIHTLQKENPQKHFYCPSSCLLCPDMKRISLDDVISALRELKHVIRIPEEIRLKALTAVNRMLAVPRD